MPLASRGPLAIALAVALLAACTVERAVPPRPTPPPVGLGTAWQLFAPGHYVGDALTVTVPALAPGERLAVLLLNAGGDERGVASVQVSGTGAASLAPGATGAPLAARSAGGSGGPPAWLDEPAYRAGILGGEALVSAHREETLARLRDGRLQRVPRTTPTRGPLAATAAVAIPATRSFCQKRYTDTGIESHWLPATLAHQSAHAAFYSTDEVRPGIDAAVAARTGVAPAGVVPFWGELAAAYEDKILPALTTYFGPESDVDGNGKMIFLLGNLGTQGSAFIVGYFWPGDLELAAADATSCPGGGTGNRADMLSLMDPGTFTNLASGTGSNYLPVLQGIMAGDYPGVMAHELQHNVSYATRCPAGAACGPDEELWLNEGLSMLSETVAGYGLHTPSGRSAVRFYQGEVDPKSGSNNLVYHRAYGLTVWEGDPRGNYAGVQAYMQYLLDHASPAMTRALENRSLTGKANVEAATGVAWELGFARFVTAAMFSNEDISATAGGTIASTNSLLASASLNYLGDGVSPDYVPWHHYTGSCTTAGTRYDKPRLAYVAYTPLTTISSVTLRRDGWAALATGPGSGGAATVTVRSSAAVRPHVAVVKYSGPLPNFTPLSSACP